jgi:hypothetical protein
VLTEGGIYVVENEHNYREDRGAVEKHPKLAARLGFSVDPDMEQPNGSRTCEALNQPILDEREPMSLRYVRGELGRDESANKDGGR